MDSEMLALARETAKEWKKKNKPRIKTLVNDMLDKRVSEIVAKLLGFDNHWGTWEVDHGNGRNGESAAGDWLRKKAGDAINVWLNKQAGNLPELPPEAIKSLLETYVITYQRQLRTEIIKLAEDRASLDATNIVKQVALESSKSTK